MIYLDYTPSPTGGGTVDGMRCAQGSAEPKKETEQVGTKTLPAATLVRVCTKFLVKRHCRASRAPLSSAGVLYLCVSMFTTQPARLVPILES